MVPKQGRNMMDSGMVNMGPLWWWLRSDELLDLVRQTSPLHVLNEETLNEVFFDLLSLFGVERLLYPVYANPHRKILEKAWDLDAGFSCVTYQEMTHLLKDFPRLDPERILLLPSVASDRFLEHAWEPNVCGVLSDLSRMKRVPDSLGKKRGFIHVDQWRKKAGTGRITSYLRGVYWFSNLISPCPDDSHAARRFISKAVEQLPEGFTLVLGNDRTIHTSAGNDCVGLQSLSDYLGDIKEANPRVAVWLELPFAMLSSAGALLTRVVETGTRGDLPFVRVNLENTLRGRDRGMGMYRRVINLSRPDMTKTRPVMILGGQAGLSQGRVLIWDAPRVIEADDVLLFTHMGALGLETDSDTKAMQNVPTQYLQARSMCPVRL